RNRSGSQNAIAHLGGSSVSSSHSQSVARRGARARRTAPSAVRVLLLALPALLLAAPIVCAEETTMRAATEAQIGGLPLRFLSPLERLAYEKRSEEHTSELQS